MSPFSIERILLRAGVSVSWILFYTDSLTWHGIQIFLPAALRTPIMDKSVQFLRYSSSRAPTVPGFWLDGSLKVIDGEFDIFSFLETRIWFSLHEPVGRSIRTVFFVVLVGGFIVIMVGPVEDGDFGKS